MIRRNLTQRLLDALGDTPVVLVHGARQVGKTTLVRAVAEKEHPARYLTLDDPAVLGAAESDPHGFVADLKGPVILDEVQRAPQLPLAIKVAVDRDRKPGRFLLTGSANVLQVPRLSESLAGRMEILPLQPFSQGEIEGVLDGFIDAVFARKLPTFSRPETKHRPLVERLVQGGYPEVQSRRDDDRRHAWFASYITTILQRDVRDLANVEALAAFPRLLSLLAARAGSLLNCSDIARSVQIPQTTLKRYLTLLETTFLLQTLPPWSSNLGLRLVKSPKLYLGDTGLLVHLLNVNRGRLESDPVLLGHVLENFVVAELRKQASWSRTRTQLFHYRTPTGKEVDVILEGPDGRVVGIEIKSGRTITADDFKGLKHLADVLDDRFHRGLLFYGGSETVPFGKDLYAVPLFALWQPETAARKG